jgi:translocation and assembly module TamB
LIRRALLTIAALATVTILAAVAALGWLVGTEGGTAWLLARGRPYFPQALAVDGVGGTLLGGLHADRIAWLDDSVQVEAQDVSARLGLAALLGKTVHLTALDVSSLRVTVERGEDDGAPHRPLAVELPVRIWLESATIRDAVVRVGDFEQRIDSIHADAGASGSRVTIEALRASEGERRLSVAGHFGLDEAFPANFKIAWQWPGDDGLNWRGRLTLKGDRERYDIEHELDAPLRVHSTGYFAYGDGGPHVSLENRWRNLEWTLADGRKIESPEGMLYVEGMPDDYRLRSNARARLGDWPELTLSLTGSGDRDGLSESDLGVQSSYGHLRAKGAVRWRDGVAWAGKADASIDWRGRAVDIAADGKLAGQAVTVEKATVTAGADTVTLHGRFDAASLEAGGEFHLPEPERLVAGLTGRLDGTFRLRGRPADPRLNLALQGQAISFGEVSLDALTAQLEGTRGAHDVRVTARAGQQELQATLHGALEPSAWSGAVDTLNLDAEPFGAWTLRAPGRLDLAPGSVEVGRSCLVNTAVDGEACILVSYGARRSAGLDLTVRSLPFTALPLALPEGVTADGIIGLTARVSLEDGMLGGNGEIAMHDAKLSAQYEGEDVVATLNSADATLTLKDNRLDSSFRISFENEAAGVDGTFGMADVLDRSAAIDGSVKFEMRDFAIVPILIPNVSNASGRIDGTLAVAGKLSEPKFRGTLYVSEGAFSLRQTGIDIKEFNAEIHQDDSGALTVSGSARSGDGELSITGRSEFVADTGMRSEARIQGNNFELMRLPNWRVYASPDVTVLLDERQLRVRGKVTVPSANITLKDIPETAQEPSIDAVVHRADQVKPAPRRVLDIDVKTLLGDDVQVSGFGLQTGVSGELRIEGGSLRPYTGHGRVSLHDGMYTAYGQKLEIERGELAFNGPLDKPNLDVRAVRKMPDVTAGVQLTGVPYQLKSTVFSEPPLSDAEALSYLLTGQPLGNVSTNQGDMLNKAAFALGLSQAGVIVSQIRSTLGLDKLAVEGGPDTSRIVAGKNLGNRLFVEYGYGIVDQLGRLLLRYRLNNRLTLESTSGQVNTLDVIYTVRKN